ncbi:ribonuclease M5 [Paraliobacillus ryukyuensis]|uniref:Toprim domain protein n=1 Tax=Paraliobacillus ryukyuensis TaxID=200904 RepID=A0A366E6X9_9BACI|nr:toprim domain-containing protein [Paraliobacillus ryukyuensis]RBO98067.1 toprim domain protein [Paraliobacillus ryukyuensis]
MFTDSEELEPVLIVEGRTDKRQIEKIITDTLTIICTNGTLGIEKMEQMIIDYDLDNREVFILVDEDEAGHKLRKQLSIELPHAKHIYIDKTFREVAATPETELATALVSRRITVNPIYLM